MWIGLTTLLGAVVSPCEVVGRMYCRGETRDSTMEAGAKRGKPCCVCTVQKPNALELELSFDFHNASIFNCRLVCRVSSIMHGMTIADVTHVQDSNLPGGGAAWGRLPCSALLCYADMTRQIEYRIDQ